MKNVPNYSTVYEGDKALRREINKALTTAVYGQTLPTSEQAAGKTKIPSDANPDSGTATPTPGLYPVNPTPMQGWGDRRDAEAVMPKLQAGGDPATTYGIQRIGESQSIPGAERTIVGDKWKYENNPQVYRDNGDWMQANVQDHWEMLDKLLGGYGFIRNLTAELSQDSRRYEDKATGATALAATTLKGHLQVTFFDRTGAMIGTEETFSGLDSLLSRYGNLNQPGQWRN